MTYLLWATHLEGWGEEKKRCDAPHGRVHAVKDEEVEL